MFKGLVSGLTNVFSTINSVIGAFDKLGMSAPVALGTIASLFTTIKALGTGQSVPNLKTMFSGATKEVIDIKKEVLGAKTSFIGLSKGTTQYSNALKVSEGSSKKFNKILNNSGVVAKKVNGEYNLVAKGTKSLSTSMVATGAKTALATVGTTLLNGALMSLAGVAISFTISKLSDYVHANEIAHDKIVQSMETTKAKISSLKAEKSELKNVTSEYDKLTKKTKLNNEESARLAELKQQIAEISPDLVVGYDANNDPILALNGNLQDYIKGLDDAIKRQNELLKTQQNAAADKSLGTGSKYTSSNLDSSFNNMGSVSHAYDDFTNPFNKDKLKSFRDGADRYVKIIAERNEKVSDLNVRNSENYEKYRVIELEQQTKAINKLSDGSLYKNFNDLNEKTKNSVSTLIGNFDWESNVANTLQGQSKFIKGFDTLSDKIGENSEQVQNWNNKLISANNAYQKTGDIESYKQSISGVTTELEKLTGISKEDWEIGFTQQLVGGLEESQISLNEFMKGYHKTIEDLNNQDPIAIKLKAEYESTQNFLSDLTETGQTFESAVDFLVKVNKGELDYENLPYQMQTFLEGALDGGSKMTTDELQAFMDISTTISASGELDDGTYGLITKMLNGELSKEEIEVGIKLPDGTTLNKNIVESINQANKSKGNKNVKVGVESDLSKFKDDLQAIFGDDKDKKLKIETEVEKKDLDGLSKSLKELDEETQIDILTSVLQNGQLTIPELEQVLNTLPPEVQTIIRTILEEAGLTEANTKLQNLPEYVSIIINTELDGNGKVELDKMAEWLNSTDLSKKVQLDIVSKVANNDLDGLLETIENLDPELQLQILSNAQSVLSTFGDLDGYKFTSKLIELSINSGDLESALSMFEKLDDEKKVSVFTELVESGNLTTSQLNQFLDLLPEEKKTEVQVSVTKQEELDSFKFKLDQIPISQDVKIQVQKDLAEGNIDGVIKTISKLPPEKQVKVLAAINEAMGGINSVDKKKINDKITNLTAKDNVSSVLQAINSTKLKDKLMNITTKYTTIKETISSIFNGGKKGSKESLGGFENISDTPTEAVSPMSEGVSNISDVPTEMNGASKVSAQSASSFGDVLTNPTTSTNISTSFKNVLNMIKYGVNLFQELENRISSTGNQLDLLKNQMEGAVGTKKISYLKTQNKLYEEQVKLQKTLFNSLNNEKNSVKSSLKSQGFSFNGQGNFNNYEEQLLKLEQAYESAKNKESDYTGDSESAKKKLSNATENANKKLDDAKKLTDKYLQLFYTDIPKAEEAWYDLQNSIKETKNEIERLDFENKIYVHKNAIDKLNNSMSLYQEYASKANVIASRYSGANKIKYMKEEISYTQKQLVLTKDLMKQQEWQLNQYSNKLKQYGVSINRSNGEISNYDSVLNKYQNSDDLDKVKQYMDDYMDLVESKLKASTSLEDLTLSMQDLNNEVNKLQLENKLSPLSIAVEELDDRMSKIQDRLSIIDLKMENAYGKDKLNLLKEQISLYEELEKLQNDSIKSMQQEQSILQGELQSNGFKFNNGEITNMRDALNKVKDSSAYEYIVEVLEQWKELHNTEIPNALNSIEDFKKSIKDAYKEQLNITQDIEEKIKDIYEKQLEDRKNAIQKETDAVKKSLEDQKKAYQDMRKEVDYQNDYTEKTDSISQLEKKLETARKDTSLSNKKKIADLEKELSDARKDLEEFVQDKIDSDVENSYDKAQEIIDESNDKKIEELEKTWSDSKIAEMISQSLKTGLFEGIDGTITNLQDAMLNFANESGDLFGVMGNIVQEELVGNLGIAVDSLRNYAEIMNELGLGKVNTNLSTGMISNRSVTTGDISINISTAANVNEQDIANKVKDAINQALQGATQGL